MTARSEAKPAAWAFVSMTLFMLVYLALALACLWQYGSPHPLARVDFFSGGALVVSVLLGLEQLAFGQALPQSEEVKREAFGLSYDPAMAKWISLLALAELCVFLDYGHWRLLPALETRAAQGAGLALYAGSLCWLRWAAACLARHFLAAGPRREVIKGGAFRYVRHPRYAGLLASRVAFALVFASPLGWLLVFGWIVVVRRRILLEEAHLQKLFGQEYVTYQRRTARLLPHLY
ncbi:MAG TPA: methyltransferase [Pyrinomonadaceae bacterium]|jgi:protein-S-isoprenylcysteine O-methyltransferase Ste14